MDYDALKRPQRGFDPDKLQSIDIPQARLHMVRALLDAIAAGAHTQATIIEATDASRRHVQYRLQAARVLGLVVFDGATVHLSSAGAELLKTRPGTTQAAAHWTSVIAGCAVLERLAPNLLADDGPDAESIYVNISAASDLSEATARRRARDIYSWRLHILSST